MKFTTTNIRQILTVAGLIVLVTSAVSAQAKLSLAKVSGNTVSINLENSVSVAGVQLTVNASSNLVLESIEKSSRIANGGWQIHQNQVNDSTINIVIIHAGLVSIAAGEGAIAQFNFSENNAAGKSSVALSRVVIADQFAQKVSVTLSNLEWTSTIAQVQEKEFTLEQNFPNPFNPSTTIRYKLELPGQVRLSIYDITGREVMRVMDQYQVGGAYSVTWNGKDEAGRQVTSGVYFAQLNMNGKFETLRMTLTK